MNKKYYLYLDESGDFNEDLNHPNKNECLVGGYLVDAEYYFEHTVPRRILANAYKAAFPGNDHLSEAQACLEVNHATEADKSKKKDISEAVLTAMHGISKFVIFENYKKAKIVSSRATYLNIMVDGIIQLLLQLVIQNPGDKITLEVLAGTRYDSVEASIIETDEYTERINERLKLETVKRDLIFNSRSEVIFSRDSDKNNHYLIPCDYICNFYITRTSMAFTEQYDTERTYRDYLESLYDPDYMFSLNGDRVQDRILDHINNGTLDAALYDICIGMIQSEQHKRSIIKTVADLKPKQVENILNGLSGYMNNVVEVERDTESALSYLEKAEQIIDGLEEQNSRLNLARFKLDIKLYRLAVYDHRGDLLSMELLFKECRSILNELVSIAENIEYAYMYYNRYAVYLFDTFQFQEGIKLLSDIISRFEAYELILAELPSVELESDQMKSLQLGKLLGTKVQILRFLMSKNEQDYLTAKETSDKAICNFALESDVRRQYQYRAQVEAEAGHFEEAFSFFCRGFGIEKWEEIFADEHRSGFGLYHLSFIAEKLAENGSDNERVKSIVKKFRDHEQKVFEWNQFPCYFICSNIAQCMIVLNMDKALIKKYYKHIFTFEKDPELLPLFRLFLLMIKSHCIGWMQEQKQDTAQFIGEMKSTLNSLREANLPTSIIEVCDEIELLMEENQPEAYYSISRLCQY